MLALDRWSAVMATAMLSLSIVGGAAAEQERPRERMAAGLAALVSTHNRGGMPALLTYDREPAYDIDNTALGKLRVGVIGTGGAQWMSGAKDLVVRNCPDGEGVEAVGTVGGVKITIEALPTTLGRGGTAWEGAAVFKVTCDSPTKLVLEWGGIGHVRIHGFHPAVMERVKYLTQPDLVPIPASDVTCIAQGSGGTLETKSIILRAAVNFVSGSKGAVEAENGSLRFTPESPVRSVYVMAAFAETIDRARELARSDPAEQEKDCRDRYKRLRETVSIETPSEAIDGAFKWAAINMEYGWVKPWGWIECLHHWGTLFSQQHNMAADWMGQTDRSRDMLESHGDKLYPSGQVPQLDSAGTARINFGGWNQFFVWGLQHYWEQTGDKAFVRRMRPILDKVVEQTFAEHDRDGNGLLGFGQQIGNQEDYVTTPEDGTSPTIAAIEMRKIQAEFARATGDTTKADEYLAAARRMEKTLRASLWNSDLGRYEFYNDSLGTRHLDGQYHTFIWPVMYGLLDQQDGYTSMRHLADTLTADDGRVFTSNNFPNHVWATVGCQAGGQQQPWATFGWAKLGDGKRAVGPLEWIANLVMNTGNAGSWPEVYEDDPNYFTPPAGVYIWGVVEALFGLSVNKPAGVLRISPCLPNDWPGAKLRLAEYELSVTQSKGRRAIECRSQTALAHAYRVAIPPSSRVEVTADGKPVEAKVEPGVNCQFVEVKLPATKSSKLELRWTAAESKPTGWPARVSPGEWFTVKTGDARVTGVSDPCSVLSASSIEKGTVRLKVRVGAAADAELYGEPGRRILTRRTVFLDVRAGDLSYMVPVDFSVVPALRFSKSAELAKTSTGWTLRFMLTSSSGTNTKLSRIEFGGHSRAITGACGAEIAVDLDMNDLAAIHPSRNQLTVILDNGTAVTGSFDASPMFAANGDLNTLATAMSRHIALPVGALSDDTAFRSWRVWYAYGHQPWASLEPPLQGLDGTTDLAPPSTPGLTFANPSRKVAVASWKMGSPSITIPVKARARALSLLVLPMLDNHDVFAPVGRVTVTCRDGVVLTRTLHFPGDFDWWGPKRILDGFATVDSDWCSNPRWEAPSSVMNVVTLDIGEMRHVDSVTVETIGKYPALGIVGVTAFGPISDEAAKALPEQLRAIAMLEPRTLFGFGANSLEGWTLAGSAWGLTDSSGEPGGRIAVNPYFADSLFGGEKATGTILSPAFEITTPKLTFLANGHSAKNYYALVDAATGVELLTAQSPKITGLTTKVSWDVSAFKGRSVRFKAVDADNATGYAWIAFEEITLEP